MRKRHLFTAEEDAYIIRRFEETRNATKIAREMNTSFNIIKKALTRLGLKTVPRLLTIAEEEAVKHDYIHSDMDTIEIAKKHDVGKHFVRMRAKTNGWKRLNWKRKYFRDIWKKNLPDDVAQTMIGEFKKRRSIASSGSNNPMFGRAAPQGAGNGWKGWYRGHYCRSLREIMFAIDMDNKGIEWLPGEKISIRYLIEGRQRTYRPDFIVGNRMIEIKPIRLHKSLSVQMKAEAARIYCKEHNMIYDLVDVEIESVSIIDRLNSGDLKFDRDYEIRFREYVTKRQPLIGSTSSSVQSDS